MRYGCRHSSLEAFLVSVGSAASLLVFARRHVLGSCGAVFPAPHPTRLHALFHPCALPTLLRHSILKRPDGSIGFSTNCPSPTPLGLGLGPGLPWADEPSPGNLGFLAGEILTPLIAYLYRHSHFCALQVALQLPFSVHRTLPYPLSLMPKFRWQT